MAFPLALLDRPTSPASNISTNQHQHSPTSAHSYIITGQHQHNPASSQANIRSCISIGNPLSPSFSYIKVLYLENIVTSPIYRNNSLTMTALLQLFKIRLKCHNPHIALINASFPPIRCCNGTKNVCNIYPQAVCVTARCQIALCQNITQAPFTYVSHRHRAEMLN